MHVQGWPMIVIFWGIMVMMTTTTMMMMPKTTTKIKVTSLSFTVLCLHTMSSTFRSVAVHMTTLKGSICRGIEAEVWERAGDGFGEGARWALQKFFGILNFKSFNLVYSWRRNLEKNRLFKENRKTFKTNELNRSPTLNAVQNRGAIKKLGVLTPPLPPLLPPQEVVAPLSTAAMKIMTTNNTIIQIFFYVYIVKKCPVIRPVFPYGNIVLQNCFSSCFHKLSQKKVLSVYYLTIVVCHGGQKEFFMSRDLYLVTWFVKSSEKLKKRRLWG